MGKLHDAIQQQNIPLIESILKDDPNSIHLLNDRGISAIDFAYTIGCPQINELLKNTDMKVIESAIPIAIANKIIIGSGANVNSNQSDGNGGVSVVAGGNVTIHQYQSSTENSSHTGPSISPPSLPPISSKRSKKIKKSLGNDIFDAVRNGNINALKIFIETGGNVNQKNEFQLSLIQLAADCGQYSALKCLIAKEADIHEINSTGKTILHYAASGGNEDCVKYLLKCGIGVNSTDLSGCTPLHLAAKGGHLLAIKYLVGKGANTSVQCQNNQNVFHYASFSGSEDCIRWLVQNADADVNAEDDIHRRPIHIAARLGHLNPLKVLVTLGGAIPTKLDETWNVLKVAAFHGHLNCVRYLIEDTITSFGNPILEAAEGGHLDIIKYLVVNGFDIFMRDNTNGWTILHYAVKSGNLDCVRYLITLVVDINAGDNYLQTSVHLAAAEGHLDIVKYLIEQGVDIHIKDSSKWTALHHAARYGRQDCVKYLIGIGVPIENEVQGPTTNSMFSLIRAKRPSPRIFTPLHAASQGGHLEIIKYLLGCGTRIFAKCEDGWTALHYAAFSGNEDCVRYFIEKEIDINVKDNSGMTPIFVAAGEDNYNALQILIECGGNKLAEAEKYLSWTPIHFAAWFGHVNSVRILVENGVDLNVKGKCDGRAPIHIAAENGHLSVLKYLVDAGANVFAKRHDGCTALRIAIECKMEDCLNFLIYSEANH